MVKKAPQIIKPARKFQKMAVKEPTSRNVHNRIVVVKKRTLMDKMREFSELPLTTQLIVTLAGLAALGFVGYLLYLYFGGGERNE